MINSGRSSDPFNYGFIQDTITSNSFGANANFTIFNGFSLKNQIIQNQYNAEADQVEIQRAKNELRTRITLAYMQVLMNQELSKIAQEQIQNIQSQYKRAKALVNEGNMPKTNLIDLDAQIATAEYDALNAKNNIDVSKLSLAQLMAFPNFNTIEIDNNLTEEKNSSLEW
nr:TolC family protein [uncultured Emticicia sp.]